MSFNQLQNLVFFSTLIRLAHSISKYRKQGKRKLTEVPRGKVVKETGYYISKKDIKVVSPCTVFLKPKI